MTNLQTVREALEFYRDSFECKPAPRLGPGSVGGLEYKPTERLLDDCGNKAIIGLAALDQMGWQPGRNYFIEHDGFKGDVIGHYVTREGKRGVVLQQDGTRVVHVYGEKWLKEQPPADGGAK